MPPATDPDLHVALADPTRRALIDALRTSSRPMGVRELAVALGLHVNSVREQLRRLAGAGLVDVSRSAPAGRGRPGLRYTIAPEREDPYRTLASLLADQVAALPDARHVAEVAGERWGRGVAANAAGTAAHQDLAVVHGLLDEAGFAPEPVAADAIDDATELRLRSCPFLPFDRRHLDVVCGVHLGFIRGALRELGSPRDAVSIEPFVRPDLCIAHVSRLPHA